MSDEFHIKYVKREDIDISKWDQCIQRSYNNLIYPYSFYLDNIAKHWDALIFADYEAIMPLTWNMKWGIKYLYQPPLTPQLGIFSGAPVSEKLIESFIEHIPVDYKFGEIFLNYYNPHPLFKKHDNYILDLSPSYSHTRSRYNKDLEKNLKRSLRSHLNYIKTYDLKKALSFHQQHYKERTPHVKNSDYARFENVCVQLQKQNELLIRLASDTEDNLLAIAVLFLNKNRIYLIESTTFEKGRRAQANHFLLDEIIREFSGKEMLLDLVGSDIPGIAHFYRNFGSVNQPYFFYRFNKLPWPLKLFKETGAML